MFNHKSEFGVTIIEALIALLILGMVVSSVALVHQQSFKTISESKIRTAAVNLARERLESLKHLDNCGENRYSDIWQSIKSKYDKEVNGIKYKVTTTIPDTTNTPDFHDLSVIPVRVIVEWDYNGKEPSISMETCYMQYLTE